MTATALTSLLGPTMEKSKGLIQDLISKSQDKLVEIHIDSDLNICKRDDPDRMHSWRISNGMVIGGAVLALIGWLFLQSKQWAQEQERNGGFWPWE
jgi:hypothetical protein